MKITQVDIQNFRNIASASYSLDDINAIVGKNHIGKTNTLQAIYWTLTDTLLDNSSDSASVKPFDDMKALVSVTLTFDNGATFSKTYKEKWTRTQGSEVETLSGHEVTYYINGFKMKTVKEATASIRKMILGETEATKNYPVDLSKAMLNPLYLFGQEEWKKARNFIIGMVGEVKDDDVFMEHPELVGIKQDLRQAFGNSEQLAKAYKDQAKAFKENIAGLDGTIQIMNGKVEENQIDSTIYENSKVAKEKIQASRNEILDGKEETLESAELRTRIAELTAKKNILDKDILEEERKAFADYSTAMELARQDYAKEVNAIKSITDKINDLKNKKEILDGKIDLINQQISVRKNHADDLRNQYVEVKSSQFKYTLCPNCGQPLNQDAFQDWQSEKDAKIVDLISKGKANNTEIERLQREVEMYEEQKRHSSDDDIKALEMELGRENKKLADKQELMNAIQPKKSSRRAESAQLDEELAEAKNRLSKLDFSASYDISEKLKRFDADHAEELARYEENINKKIIFDDARKTITECMARKTGLLHDSMEVDEKIAELRDFIKYKLEMVNESTKKAFPDIDFVMIEKNIKEGSFNEVCYPKIIGKETPFIKGSNSERILTGIAIIEDIRNYLQLEEIPIIFDEGETLDSQSFSEIRTSSQVITSIVKDGYEEPKMVAKSRS